MYNRKIIMLDIDGTLNDNSWREDKTMPWIMHKCVINLNIISKATKAELVLTSQRRSILHTGRINLSGFQVLLKSHGIIAPLLGYLPWSENWSDKPSIIKDWLHINCWKQYVILDNTPMPIDNQIISNSSIGLTKEGAIEAIEILHGLVYRPAAINDDVSNNTIEIME